MPRLKEITIPIIHLSHPTEAEKAFSLPENRAFMAISRINRCNRATSPNYS